MNKIILAAAVALTTLGAVAAQAADGRDPTVYGQAGQAALVEGRNAAVSLPTVSNDYIKAATEQNARSTR